MQTISLNQNYFLLLTSLVFGLSSASALAQRCDKAATPTTPTTQFSLNKNATVTDNKTKLIWQRCYLGQSYNQEHHRCEGSAETMAWDDALQAGHNSKISVDKSPKNWRLPSLKELSSIIEKTCYSPAINQEVFPGEGFTAVWAVLDETRKGHDIRQNSFFLVNFVNGNVNYLPRNRHGAVRLVHKGQ